MISIRIQGVSKHFGTVVALQDVSLEIGAGELFFLLGPSGCGKTTLLRMLAGFVAPEGGRIFFDDEDVTALAPHKRNTGMVFQSYALWPHLTVAENVAFGLEERKLPAREIAQRTGEALAAVHMTEHGQRRPGELSGGQQQRVALARALVIRPRCLLLDEPLSNLDARLRTELRSEIRRIARESRLTTVYVTHDQKEALSIADRIAIMDAGRIMQIGTAAEVYRRPRTRAVADFVGETDFIPGTVLTSADGAATVETKLGRFAGVQAHDGFQLHAGDAVTLSIRPECWKLRREPPAQNGVRGRIGGTVYYGELAQYDFIAGDTTLQIVELNPRFLESAAGGELYASAEPEDVVVLKE